MKKLKKILGVCLALALTLTSIQPNTLIYATDQKENLALHKTVKTSYADAGFPASNAVDGNKGSRWATETSPQHAGENQWIQVDLGEEKSFDEFYIVSEPGKPAQHIGKFKIEGSNDELAYDVIFDSEDTSASEGFPEENNVKLDKAVQYRYVKITIEKLRNAAYPSISLSEFGVLSAAEDDGDDTPRNENLALNKQVSVSAADSSMPGSNLTDADTESRWSTESAPTQWAYVDLGKEYSMNTFKTIWESDAVCAFDYAIYVSNDNTSWGSPVITKVDREGKESKDVLDTPVKGRYVKLEVTKMKGYQSVSARDFAISLSNKDQDPKENVALHKTAVSESNENADFTASKAVDGNTTAKESRWASGTSKLSSWIYVDLGQPKDVKTVKLFWERKNATNYEIQIANTLSSPMAEEDWQSVASYEKAPTEKNQKVLLDKTYEARYVRVKINSFIANSDGVDWPTVALYELEVYGGDTKADISDIVNGIKVENPAKGDKKLDIRSVVDNPVEGFDIAYNGTDYEQIIGSDLSIYQPIVDTNVKVSFKVTNQETKEYKFKEVQVLVPGMYTQEENDNALPSVLPELREWKGGNGNFSVSDTSKIVVADASLSDMANVFADDYKDMTGKTLAVQVGGNPSAHDFYFALSDDVSKGYQDEGYRIDISDKVSVEATTSTGAFWSTRTILQILKQNDNTTIPQGITRDYPLYKVRGFILDVGRKTFELDWLKQLTKEMSWYKMNDFQVHLNDNLIPLEDYTNAGKDPMQAYSGFRLESDIKKGGNNGLNQADLTSTDVFYTKDDFRDFIKDSRVRGVNIIPEIDTPAHSLALTKVRPDLRLGLNGRENDHLNLVSKYDESLSFVQSIFSEYMDGENPVFDAQTPIHVGADEYSASSQAYRKFCNDMLKFVQDTGRTARIWGSLSYATQGEKVTSKDVQMNLWNYGWANMDKMYEEGFDLINCNDGNYYIVPNAGYYYDYLSQSGMYNWDINSIGGVTIPAGDKQMIGGAFAVWNDMTDYLSNGVSEYDVYDRIYSALPLYASNVWGKGNATIEEAKATSNAVGSSPNTNLEYDVASKDENIAQYNMEDLKDSSNNGYDLLDSVNASLEKVDFKQVLKLNGKESFMTTPIENAGLGNDLRVKVKRTSADKTDQILFESSYGSIKAVQAKTGNVGFSREGYDYSFNYELPVNVWVELEFKNTLNQTQLYVDGVLVDTLGDDETTNGRPYLSTLIFPVERIGSKTNAFQGYVSDVRLAKSATYASTMKLDRVVMNAKAYLKTVKNKSNEELQEVCNQADALAKEYNPDAEKVAETLAKLEDVMSKIDYPKADYTKIDSLLALLPKDTSVFTKESLDRFTYVKNSIEQNIHVSLQSAVDGYAISLANAINGLKVKETKDLTVVDSATLKATASSQNSNAEAAAKTIDGNDNTFWHTVYSNTTMPHTLTLELKDETVLSGYSYLPRQSGTNGIITKYQIQTSLDGVDYKTVKEGSWTNDKKVKMETFAPVNAKFVRLVAVEAVGNFASAAEVKLYLANITPDVDGLRTVITDAKKIQNNGYTSETWDAFVAAIESAEAVLADATADANTVHAAKMDVISKQTALRMANLVSIDRSALQSAIDKAELIIEDKYTADSLAVFKEAYIQATALMENKDATQVEVNEKTEALLAAIAALELKEESKADKQKLDEVIKKAEGIDQGKYTVASISELNDKLAKAKAIFLAQNATQAEVDQAEKDLQTAIDNLVIKEADKSDKSALQAIMKEAEAVNVEKYTAASVEALQKAMADANTVLKNANATQAEVDKALQDVRKAMDALVLLSTSDSVDKTELTQWINNATSIDTKNFTTASVKRFNEALANANAILNQKDATQKQVDDALKALLDAMASLEEEKANNTETDKEDVDTGDTTNAGLWLLVTIGAGILVVASRRKFQKR